MLFGLWSRQFSNGAKFYENYFGGFGVGFTLTSRSKSALSIKRIDFFYNAGRQSKLLADRRRIYEDDAD